MPVKMRKGFTLIEMIIALGVGSLLLTATLSLFMTSNKANVKQDRLISAQQFVRSALEIMAYELRMAGYIPEGVQGYLGAYPTPLLTAEVEEIEFLADLNADGDLERVKYYLDHQTTPDPTLMRFKLMRQSWDYNPATNDWTAQTTPAVLAQNIAHMTLIYVYKDGTAGLPQTTPERQDVRAVGVRLVASTPHPDPGYTAPDGTHYHYRELKSYVDMRNIDLE